MSGPQLLRSAWRPGRRPCRRSREAGYAVLGVMVGVSIVSVALISHALVAAHGVLAARGARNQFACRQGALARLNALPPVASGGSVAPNAAVDGWSDRVYIDPRTGAVVAAGAGVDAGAVVIARQWRRGPDGGGRQVFEVSATAVDEEGRPLDRWLRAEVVLSRRAR